MDAVGASDHGSVLELHGAALETFGEALEAGRMIAEASLSCRACAVSTTSLEVSP